MPSSSWRWSLPQLICRFSFYLRKSSFLHKSTSFAQNRRLISFSSALHDINCKGKTYRLRWTIALPSRFDHCFRWRCFLLNKLINGFLDAVVNFLAQFYLWLRQGDFKLVKDVLKMLLCNWELTQVTTWSMVEHHFLILSLSLFIFNFQSSVLFFVEAVEIVSHPLHL